MQRSYPTPSSCQKARVPDLVFQINDIAASSWCELVALDMYFPEKLLGSVL